MGNSVAIGAAYQDQDLKGSATVYAAATSGQIGYNTGSATTAPSTVNSAISAYDIPVIAIASGAATAGTYLVSVVAVAAGSFTIAMTNASTGSLSEALTINFATIHVAQA